MFDRFEKEKKDFLNKKDKSKKGSIDKDIIKVVEKINYKKDYYTTSSCAGRIMLIEMRSSRKYECHWLLAKHEKIKFYELLEALNRHKSKNEVWLKQQPIILHVACSNPEAAVKMIDATRKIFRRAGIIGLSNKKVVLEIIGDERLETIVADKDFIADKKYIKNLVKYANKNFDDNERKINKFFEIIK